MRIILSRLCVALGLLIGNRPLLAQQERVDWLKEHSVALRTIAPDSTDFSDLEPLRARLAGVRVVHLGELTHGDGNASAARVRLIKFLHEKLGFNVLVWEAGFDATERMSSLLPGDVPIEHVAESALWPFWSESAQIRSLFSYARDTHKTAAPLHMTGFDLQFTGGGWAVSGLLSDVRSWFDVAQRPLPPAVGLALDSAQQRLARNGGTQIAAPRALLLAHAPALLAHFEVNAAAIRDTHGAARASRYQRVLRSLAAYRTLLDLRQQAPVSADSVNIAFEAYNVRERTNADNLLWLLNEGFPGQKMIIWSHNVHAMHLRTGWRYDSVFTADQPMTFESTGRLLKQKLGGALYTIGTQAYEGEWGFPGQAARSLSKAPPGALAELLYQTGEQVRIVDLRAARTTNHWLMQPLLGALTAQIPDRWAAVIWPEAFDGLLFVPRLTAASLVTR